jgi:hypothetical protein
VAKFDKPQEAGAYLQKVLKSVSLNAKKRLIDTKSDTIDQDGEDGDAPLASWQQRSIEDQQVAASDAEDQQEAVDQVLDVEKLLQEACKTDKDRENLALYRILKVWAFNESEDEVSWREYLGLAGWDDARINRVIARMRTHKGLREIRPRQKVSYSKDRIKANTQAARRAPPSKRDKKQAGDHS